MAVSLGDTPGLPAARHAVSLPTLLRDALGGGQTGVLPPRVLKAIRRQDRSSEVLIKAIQLAIVAVFGTLYLVSPKTDAGTAFSPVPYALGSYLTINVLGLVWALRRGLPNWAVYASIVVDIALLMVLIWSFHVQYRQPASFYLKVPTLLYVFIFIALRALRFEARFVLAAGLVAAAGWLLMVANVALSDPADSMITRNYVTYLTSNAVLIGAEIDKIISILFVSGILWLALRRARGLLVRAVSDQFAAENLSRFFDAPVAEQIRTARDAARPGDGARCEAAILAIDIRGFTRLAADLDPREVLSLLTAYQRRVVPIIQRHGGAIDKFLGDGILASFGAARASDTHAADALRAVDDIMDEVRSWPAEGALAHLAPHAINAAVAAGSVVFGTLGDENRLEYTVIGAAVNLTAKLEKHNKVVGCRALTTRETYDKALAQGYVPRRPPRIARGAVEGAEGVQELAVLHG